MVVDFSERILTLYSLLSNNKFPQLFNHSRQIKDCDLHTSVHQLRANYTTMANVNLGAEVNDTDSGNGNKSNPSIDKPSTNARDQSSERIELKKNVSMLNGIGLIVGSVIGSGIFISPTGILTEVNSVGLSLIVWLGCGLLAMFGCLCYTELGTFITKSGGEYAYLKEAFGRLPAFLFAWTSMIIIRPSSGAIIALIFAEYVSKPFFPDCEAPVVLIKLLACLCLGKIQSFISSFVHSFVRSFVRTRRSLVS